VGDGTRVVRAGLPQPAPGEPLLPGPVFAAPYHLPAGTDELTYGYGRSENPTWSAFERALGELEGGETVVFASGMAAATAVLQSFLRRGDTLLMVSDGYFTVREFTDEHLLAAGVRVIRRATADPELARLAEDAALIWIESPSNPGLDVCDIAAIAGAAHRGGGLVAVDNSLATPLGQRPLELGADLSVAADTKGLTGHSDLIVGHVAARDAELAARVRSWRLHAGAVAGPFEVWLAHRSLATLDVRLQRQCENALAVARAAAAEAGVGAVRYPGLPGDPAHALAARQMRRFGGVLTIDLGDEEAADRFLAALRIVVHATSFGGVHSSAERRARWGGDDVSPGLIRLSAGIEDGDDLVEDVTRAIAAGARA
jgi:cystathionine gamma-lyase